MMTTDIAPGLSRIGQIAITVRDLPRAVAFYRDVLRLPFLFEAPPGLAFFDCAGIRLMLTLPEGSGEQYASIIYYKVDDIHEAARALETRGAIFESAPHLVARLDKFDLWLAGLHDSEGNLLELMSEVAR
jgi:predicted enzyme related to lactoylglutathione lyase